MSTGLDLIPVKPTTAIVGAPSTKKATASKWFRLLVNDRVAAVAAVILAFVFLVAIFGPMLIGDLATKIDLDNSNQAPFTFAHGWANFLGTDPLGRSMLARLIVACQTTLSVAIPAVVISAIVGSAIGMWAGYYRGWRETVAMRVADVIMSFPSLLLAVVVLYVFSPERREHRCWCWRSPASPFICAPPARNRPSCPAGCSSMPHAPSAPAAFRSSAGTCCRSCCPRC